MTRDEIIKEIIDKEFVEKVCTTFGSILGENKDDFYGEFWLIILDEIPEDKLINLYNNKQLYFYLLSIARNQITNDKSKFNKKYQTKIDKVDIENYLRITEENYDNDEY